MRGTWDTHTRSFDRFCLFPCSLPVGNLVGLDSRRFGGGGATKTRGGVSGWQRGGWMWRVGVFAGGELVVRFNAVRSERIG